MSQNYAEPQENAEHEGELSSKIQWLHQQRMGWQYIRFRLREESRRSERYGHVFSIVFISAPEMEPDDLAREVRHRIRGSDVISPVEAAAKSAEGSADDNEEGAGVAAILPETGEEDAAAACDRLRRELRDMEVSVGFAVYPHDSTVTEELLELARMRGA